MTLGYRDCPRRGLDLTFPGVNIPCVEWDVEYTDEFGGWWDDLDESEQESVATVVGLLRVLGPRLPSQYSSKITTFRHSHMRELKIQHKGDPYRMLYAFDPRRTAILLLGGDKTGDDRWYDKHVPKADRLYDEHLAILKKEGLIDG